MFFDEERILSSKRNDFIKDLTEDRDIKLLAKTYYPIRKNDFVLKYLKL